eukprot:CAMPEP_0201515554 /NCGR_PEP_ID=MMETSP0161_2-20130828/7090_1 /ASSEMBLY_ACC=CAM_ASM_000251 /TAXON_ID=180227 /ORGANISM="Neoparamoeba aestuarina, Strain SoJaBio B1-5/56/2" /LENGTH=33 /DNA_ID= /DNA_START= /DNA_END= /DNA_ORIENTATION=
MGKKCPFGHEKSVDWEKKEKAKEEEKSQDGLQN